MLILALYPNLLNVSISKKSISDTGLENISTVEFEVHAYK